MAATSNLPAGMTQARARSQLGGLPRMHPFEYLDG